MGEDMFHILAQQNSTRRNFVSEPGFIEPLPDIACGTTMDGSFTVTPYIYICQMTLLDFQSLLLDRQFSNFVLAEGNAGFL